MFKDRSLQVKVVSDKESVKIPRGDISENKADEVADAVIRVTHEVARVGVEAVAAYIILDTLRKVSVALASK